MSTTENGKTALSFNLMNIFKTLLMANVFESLNLIEEDVA